MSEDEHEMDRINFTQPPAAQPKLVSVREPKLMDPSASLRIADRKDSVELSSLSTKSAAAESMERLIAARVIQPVGAPAPVETKPAAAASSAIRFYTNPTDQNAAATMGAGSKLDVLA